MQAVERAKRLRRLERLAWTMDQSFGIPGTKIRLGWDGIIGLLFGAGDTATALVSLYFVWEGLKMGAGAGMILRMLLNIGIDWLVGLIPVLGDLFDVGWKANRRNYEMLRRHFGQEADDSA